MRLLDPEGPKSKRRVRIARSTLIETLAFVVVTALMPALLLGAVVSDLVLWIARRKPWMGVRMVLFAWWFLFGELRGLAGLGVVWMLAGGPWSKDSPTRRRRVFGLQVSWAAGHLAGVRRLFGLKLEIEGDELVEPGPVIVFIRHASIIDNTLPAAVVSRPHKLDLRYVLKRELEMLPTLDVGARWVPTCFVNRASDDSEREIANVRSLAEQLGPNDGVLIYPEGTRCTAEKLARAQAKLVESDPVVGGYAARLRHVLPPRLGGPLAVLDEARDAAVVICGHVGLDGFEYLSDIYSGALVGTTIRVRFWRHEPSEIPVDRDARIEWLYERWQVLDDWIDEQRAGDKASRERPPKAGRAGSDAAAPVS
jgi:1-acyl-sn-glycerol-3-phosphate acyltransferase